MTFDVGRRLRRIRTHHRLSQRKLALSAGVTHGLISQIEQNHTSPSVASLKLILDAIPMSFAEFFDDGDGEPASFVYRAADLPEINPLHVCGIGDAAGEPSGISFRRVGHASNRTLQFMHECYAPGADTGAECYRHDAEEAGLVIRGEIELTVAGEVAVLTAGDGYLFDSRKPHRFRNVSDERCEIVSACTPSTF